MRPRAFVYCGNKQRTPSASLLIQLHANSQFFVSKQTGKILNWRKNPLGFYTSVFKTVSLLPCTAPNFSNFLSAPSRIELPPTLKITDYISKTSVMMQGR